MGIWLYIVAGEIGVLNMVLWGIYGDLLAEKFHIPSVLRSLVFGFAASAFIFFLNPHLPLFIVGLIVISLERITTEIYKALWRAENQSKYVIPSDWNLKLPQFVRASLAVILEASLLCVIALFDLHFNKVIGAAVAGLLVALRGMLKDAPHEGFYPRKFFDPRLSACLSAHSLYFYILKLTANII